MFYKKWTLIFITSFFSLFGITLGVLILIDPLDIWSMAKIPGLNNNKVEQASYLDIFKPYQYIQEKPDVVFMGTSRVYVGFSPDNFPHGYNMGFSSLSIKDAYSYFQFMCKTHKPKTIYLGLDYFQFGKKNNQAIRPGFSMERLEQLEKNWMEIYLYKIGDTLGQRNLAKKTFLESWAAPEKGAYFIKGWDKKRGDATELNTKEFPNTVNAFFNDYKNWERDPAALITLNRMVTEAKKENIEMVVFFNPVTVDHLLVLYTIHQLSDFAALKKAVAEITPFWDFAYVNPLTTDRALFYEASHFRKGFGEKIAKILSQSNLREIEFGVLLRKENVTLEIEKMNHRFMLWLEKNSPYKTMMAFYYKKGVPMPAEAFKKVGVSR